MAIIEATTGIADSDDRTVEEFTTVTHRTGERPTKVEAKFGVSIVGQSASEAAILPDAVSHRSFENKLFKPELRVLRLEIIQDSKLTAFSTNAARFYSAKRHLSGGQKKVVHADHPDLESFAGSGGSAQRAREDISREAEGESIRSPDHFVETLKSGNRCDRYERLLIHNSRGLRHLTENRGSKIETAFKSFWSFTAGEQFRAV